MTQAGAEYDTHDGVALAAAPDVAVLTKLVDQLGTDRFERELYSVAASLAEISVVFAIEIRDDGAPGRVLVAEGRDIELTDQARKIAIDYAEAEFNEDVVLKKHNQGPPGTLEMVVQKASEAGEDFLKWFFGMVTADEISVYSRDPDKTLYLGISSTRKGFRPAEKKRISRLAPLLLSLVRKHTQMVDASGDNIHALRGRRLTTVQHLLTEAEPTLTQREAEVCAAIVVGYRAETIGERLGISPFTVATHRKRAYSKLRISSQAELFGTLFKGWLL